MSKVTVLGVQNLCFCPLVLRGGGIILQAGRQTEQLQNLPAEVSGSDLPPLGLYEVIIQCWRPIALTLNILLVNSFVFLIDEYLKYVENRITSPLVVSQGSLPVKSCNRMMTSSLRIPATGNNSNLQSILSSPKVFYPQNQITAPTLAPVWARNIVRNKCGACLDRRSVPMGLWIKHVALIKNNLAQKCQRPLRSITPPLPSIHSLHLTGFKEKGPWLALATFREFIQIL